MQIIPAIDIKDGACVRLQQGDFNRKTVFGDDPVAMAKRWQAQGAKRLHVVDLDGALEGKTTHFSLIAKMVQALDIPVQIGGGIRTLEAIGTYLELGVSQVILGTSAVTNSDFLITACAQFSQKIILGLDAQGETIATQGWLESAGSLFDFLQQADSLPLFAVIYTDIAKDGMLQGINQSMLLRMLNASKLPIIASGGVSCLEDVAALRALNKNNLYGLITGRALYGGELDLAQAIAVAQSL